MGHCMIGYMGYPVVRRDKLQISRTVQISKFEIFGGRHTDKSSEIFQNCGLLPSRTECIHIRIGWALQWA